MKDLEKVIRDWAADEVLKQEAAAPPQIPQPPPQFHPIFPANPLFHMAPPHRKLFTQLFYLPFDQKNVGRMV